MGLEIFKIGLDRDVAAVSCDCPRHGESARTAWFECGSHAGNLSLAKAAGWVEGRRGDATWICPQCAQNDGVKLEGRALEGRAAIHKDGISP
jgi:hypothetical protein